ncbi:MAG: transglycosylase SLT domain-containing protein [Armatimonadota bacterium]|nr:transglycosylase SLT domain-containing protein [Armatimonadota bacterium]MDR5704204.1 transglycosylase SLT domain-containing protein [Armatimonadota bacterium]
MVRGLVEVLTRIWQIEGRFRPFGLNPRVEPWVSGSSAEERPQESFLSELRRALEIRPTHAKIREIAVRIAQEEGVDPALVLAVIQAESGFRVDATSFAGAMGLMQLMPETARALGVKNPYDPEANIRGGVRYLAQLIARFGRVDLALAAYNAGPGAVERFGEIPPFPETRAFVARVLQAWRADGGVGP